MTTMHPTLLRLDRLAEQVAARGDALAVIGLGSAGSEYARFDQYSDIDVFVVAESAEAQAAYSADAGWLRGLGGDLVYSFANEPHGRKALFADGLFVEAAVLTADELQALPHAGTRVVWQRPGLALDLDDHPGPPRASTLDTVDFHLNEALSNLYVGLQRERRGERLTALRFIQVYAVDRVLALLRLAETTAPRDPFEATRRVERAYSATVLPLADMVPGYLANAGAAATTLHWLRSRYATDPAITSAVEDLVSAVDPERSAPPR